MDMSSGIGFGLKLTALAVQCATVLKKSAACLIAAIMNGVKFYRKSDSLRQKSEAERFSWLEESMM